MGAAKANVLVLCVVVDSSANEAVPMILKLQTSTMKISVEIVMTNSPNHSIATCESIEKLKAAFYHKAKHHFADAELMADNDLSSWEMFAVYF